MGQVVGFDFAKVGIRQSLASRRVQPLIRGEVAQVEEAVAHAGVLPIQEANGVPVFQEVGGQQVVVARNRIGRRGQCPLDGLSMV